LDLGLIVVDGVGGFDLEGNGFASEGLDEDLHTAAETKDENAFLALDLGLDVVDCVRRLHFKGAGDRLTGQGLDKNLHATKAKDEVECRLPLDVVIQECSTIFKLLSGED